MQTALLILDRFMHWLLETSWQAGVLIVLVLLVRAAFGRRLTPRWRHALWLLVMLRLVMPAMPGSPTSVFNLGKLWARSPQASTMMPAPVSAAGDILPVALSDSAAPIAHAARADGVRVPPMALAALIWLVVALALAVRMAVRTRRQFSGISALRAITDEVVLNVLEDCRRELGVRVPVSIVPTDSVRTPALLGFVRPRIMLPVGMADDLSADELRDVFLHELAHVRRHDVALNLLMSLAQLVHWFNPLVWLAAHRMRSDQEQACDSLVVAATGKEGGYRYGKTMLRLLDLATARRRLPAVAGILEDKAEIAARLRLLATYGPRSYRFSPLATVLLVLLASIGLTGAQVPRPGEPATAPQSPAAPEPVPVLEIATNKMESIVLPQVEFRQANIRDVISFLRNASRTFDKSDLPRSEKGVDIILDPELSADAEVVPLLTFSARNVSLLETVRIVTQLANLTFAFAGNTITIGHSASAAAPLPKANVDAEKMQRISSKLNRIVIPEIEFRAANIHDIIQFLYSASVEYDEDNLAPSEKGVNIILNLQPGKSDRTPDPFAKPSGTPTGVPLLTLSVANISMMDALNIVMKAANLQWHIEGSVIMITPDAAADVKPVASYAVRVTLIQCSAKEARDFDLADLRDQGGRRASGAQSGAGDTGSTSRKPSQGHSIAAVVDDDRLNSLINLPSTIASSLADLAFTKGETKLIDLQKPLRYATGHDKAGNSTSFETRGVGKKILLTLLDATKESADLEVYAEAVSEPQWKTVAGSNETVTVEVPYFSVNSVSSHVNPPLGQWFVLGTLPSGEGSSDTVNLLAVRITEK